MQLQFNTQISSFYSSSFLKINKWEYIIGSE